MAVRHKGKPGRACLFCGAARGLIRKYNLCVCRKCFRERARALGFEKYM